MDRKLALLSSLVRVSESYKVSEESVHELRYVLSLFEDEILSEDEYDEIIEELKAENYLHEKDSFYSITKEGIALSNSITERILGQTSFEALMKMVGEYKKNKNIYLKTVNESLKSLQERQEKKLKDEDMSQARAVGMVLKIKHKSNGLYVHEVKISSDLLRDEDALTKEINASVKTLIKKTGLPISAVYRGNSIIEVTSYIPLEVFRLFSTDYRTEKVTGIEQSRVFGWNKLVASVYLEQGLGTLGYIRSQWPGRDFIKYNDFRRSQTNLGELRESSAFEVEITELPDDKVFVWLQSYTSPTKRVSDFINEEYANATREQILSILSSLKIRSIPSGNQVQIKDILLQKNITKEKIPGMTKTYLQYWEESYGIEMNDTIQPIAVIQGRGTDFHYPAETLFIDRYSLQDFYHDSLERRIRHETPAVRAGKCQDIYDSLDKVRIPKWDRYLETRFEQCNPSLDYLRQNGLIEKAIRIHQPMLEFNAGAISLDPTNIFINDFAPKCGYKTLTISHFFTPKTISEEQVNTFIKGLQKAFAAVGFGRIVKSQAFQLVRFDETNKDEFETSIRDLVRINENNNIAICIIPDGRGDFYFSAKRLFPSRVGIPIQAVAKSSFFEALEDKFRGYKILCLKILIKSLKHGETIWTLSNNAGLLAKKSMYIAIGYSAYPKEGRVSKCAAVMHDAKGNKVSWKVFSTVQTRTINKPWFDTLLLKIRDIVEREKPERLVIYRTGRLYPIEMEAINSSLANCDWIKALSLNFISVLEESNYRFFLSQNYKNLPAGYAIIFNDREGFISSSNYDDRSLRQGTIIPVGIRLEIGQEPISDILREYHDLTYLNWSAPYTTAKHPLLITIAERFAELEREYVPTESMFYLDL